MTGASGHGGLRRCLFCSGGARRHCFGQPKLELLTYLDSLLHPPANKSTLFFGHAFASHSSPSFVKLNEAFSFSHDFFNLSKCCNSYARTGKRWNMRRMLMIWLMAACLPDVDALAEPPAGTRIVYPVDEAIMVYVPGGEFIMGIDKADGDTIAAHLGFKDASAIWALEAYPKRTVVLPGFFIDECEVTVERWQNYIKATGVVLKSRETSRHFDNPAARQFPAGEILWEDAGKYAAWAGKALPTEAQWEKAARGTDGRFFPWGNDPPSVEHGHFGQKGKRPGLYVPVGRYPKGASPYGALDMLGNQYEWTADRKKLYPGHQLDPDDPQTEKVKQYCDGSSVVLRGGSWYHGWISFYGAKRFGLNPDETYYHVGFRTVWIPPAGYFESPEFEKSRAAAVR